MSDIDFSHYQLSLLSFLQESHPELAANRRFIRNRAKQAATAYERAFDDGFGVQESIDMANHTLYAGLHFSRHDTIENTLWSEFSSEVTADASRECAIRLRPLLDPIFSKYDITDDFAYTPEYQSLTTELIGAIQQKLEDDGKL